MTKIKEIKKLKRLYKVSFDEALELDGDFTDKIYLSEDSIVHFFLTLDKSFSEEELNEWSAYDQFARGKSLALYYLGFKARTSGEVRKYLLEKEIFPLHAEEVLEHLNEIGVLNDRQYAENFIQGKINMATSGPFQIKQKLLLKGIEGSTIDEVLDDIYIEESQIDVAYKIAEKLVRSKGGQLTLQQLKNKITQNLVSKGFSYSIAKIALDSLELEADEEQEMELLYDEFEKVARRVSRNYDGYERKQKITQALARKGFSFDDISRALRDYTFED